MKCSDTHNCRFNLWIDKEMSPKADKVFMVGKESKILKSAREANLKNFPSGLTHSVHIS